jgi:2-methylcitrate dehydratase PrpD
MPSASPGRSLHQFARGDSGVVKRLHRGRVSETGVLAASLAANGFEGLRTVLEGELGVLKRFCRKWHEAELTRGLGEEFFVPTTVLKRYPRHGTVRSAFKAVRDMQAADGFRGAELGRSRLPALPAWSIATTFRNPPI